jgi:hypothetical protein
VVAVTAFVQQAGLSNQVERGASSSLTDLTYRCLPAPRAAERERGM